MRKKKERIDESLRKSTSNSLGCYPVATSSDCWLHLFDSSFEKHSNPEKEMREVRSNYNQLNNAIMFLQKR